MKSALIFHTISDKISNFIRRFSIRKRLLIIYLIQIGIIALWCVFIINSFISDYTSYININNTKIVNVFTENMRNIISALEAVTKYPILRTNAQPTMTYQYLSNPSEYSSHILYNDLDSRSMFLFEQHPSIRLVAVFDLFGNGSFIQNRDKYVYNASTTDKLFINKRQAQNSWFKTTLEHEGSSLIWNMEDLKESIISDNDRWIFASRAIFNTERFENIGVILAAADVKYSLSEFQKNKIFEEQNIGFFDLSGRLLAGDIDKNKYNQIYNKALSSSDKNSTGSFILNIDGQKNLYNYSTTLDGYFCVLETPYYLIISNTLKQQHIVFLLIIFSFLIIAISSKFIVNSITNPLKTLVKACERIKHGNFSVHIEDNTNDELSDFTNSFNSMIKEIKRLIHEVYEQDILLTKTELQLLRSQINPHFVYNILETIRTTADMNGEKELSEMAFLLANTLRYGISQPTEIVPVSREIEMLKSYVRLQKLLHKDKIELILHVEPRIMNCYMPKLLLQPLVENAFFHGTNSAQEKRIVTLLGFIEEDHMLFQVIDNGDGMNAEELDNLRGYINNQNNLYKGIGLKNVNRRIQLYYGKKYGIGIDSSPGKGTMVTIRIPIKLQEKDETYV